MCILCHILDSFRTGVPNLWYEEAFQAVREMFSKNAKKLFSRNPHKNFFALQLKSVA